MKNRKEITAKNREESTMKKLATIVKPILSLLLIALLATTLSPANVSAAKKVKLNKTKITLKVGQTKTLKLKNNKKKVKWSSNKKKIASVSKKGKVTARKKGAATITAKVGKKKYKCKVTVKPAAKKNTEQTTVTPPATPSVPTTNVINNYARLKSYILNYGSVNSSGNRFIKRTDTSGNNYGIVYNSATASFDFIFTSSTTSASDAFTMNIRESNVNKGDFKYIVSFSTGLAATLTASGNINTLHGDSTFNWDVVSNTNEADVIASLKSLCDSTYSLAYYGWDILISESLGLTMYDLGFTGQY